MAVQYDNCEDRSLELYTEFLAILVVMGAQDIVNNAGFRNQG